MIQLIGRFKGGKLVYSSSRLNDFAERYEGKLFLMSVHNYSGGRTIAEIGFYWAGVVDGAIKNCESFKGWSKEDLHEWLKIECNKKEVTNQRTGEISFIASTTTTLGKYDYAAYIDRCIIRLAQEGYAVELPSEYYDRLGREREKEMKEDDANEN